MLLKMGSCDETKGSKISRLRIPQTFDTEERVVFYCFIIDFLKDVETLRLANIPYGCLDTYWKGGSGGEWTAIIILGSCSLIIGHAS